MTPSEDSVTIEPELKGYPREIAAQLHSGLSKLSRQIRNISLPAGITPERLSTLATIEAHGRISVTALAEMERVRPATMSRMISSLVDDGLVKRQEDKEDRRGVLVSATAKGRRTYQRANKQYLKELSAALTHLEADQLQAMRALASALEKLGSALER
jgi:DNA-binding MarR family transcriptional regulator